MQTSETQRVAAQDHSIVKNSELKPEEEKKLLTEDKSIVIDGDTPIDQRHNEEIQTRRAQ